MRGEIGNRREMAHTQTINDAAAAHDVADDIVGNHPVDTHAAALGKGRVGCAAKQAFILSRHRHENQ